MLSEAVAIGSEDLSCFVEGQPLLTTLGYELGAHEIGCLWAVRGEHAAYIECLGLLGRDVCDLGPYTLFLTRHGLGIVLTTLGLLLAVENWGNAQAEGRPRHQVRYYALVGLAFVNLSELFFVIDLDANPVLEHVLNMLLPLNELSVFIRGRYDLLEIGWVTPGDLDGR